MKKISILLMLVISALTGFSQTLDEINDMMGKKDFAGAKVGIDKYLADEKNTSKSDGWYFKGRVYNAYSYDKAAPAADLYSLKAAAYDAFKKSQQLDPKDVRMIVENYSSYLDLYFGFYDLGANLFNAKDYEGAYSAFVKAGEVKDFILSKQYKYTQATLHPLDTALVLNTAISATQAKKEDEAIPYYRKITDANVAGDGYKEVYEYLVEYYNKKKDPALADMLAKGKKFYPDNNYWNQIELDNIEKNGDKNALFQKYEEMIAKEPSNFALNFNYAIELFNKIYSSDDKSDDAAKEKLSSVLKAAIVNDQGIDATVLLSNHLYNRAAEYQAASNMIKGTKPDDIKKKAEMKALMNKNVDESISYGEKAILYFDSKADKLKPAQMATYKKTLDNVSELYEQKGDKKKSAEYEKRRSALK